MNLTTRPLRRFLAVAAAGAALSFAAYAQPEPPFGPPPGLTQSPPPSEAMPIPGDGTLPFYLQGLNLTEAQRNKIVAIVQDSDPKMREQFKAVKQAADELRDLTFGEQYNESRAKALAEASGKAAGALALLRVHTDRQILAVLTPEQRQTISAKMPR